MTPDQYENYVAEHFIEQGYEVTQTPYTNDYGVDAFAEKENIKYAIQAKMFGGTNRKINRQMVMEFHGAKDYFDCQYGIIVTDGEIIDNAKQVADKLGILVKFLAQGKSLSLNGMSEFDRIWSRYAMALAGKTIKRNNGKTNEIVSVDWSGVSRITSNGNTQDIDIEIFKKTVNHILHNGSITRKEINEEYSKRASSGIILFLAQLPMFRLNESRPMSIERV